MTSPLGNSGLCSLESVSVDFVSGNKIHCSPWDQSLSVNYFVLQLAQKNKFMSCVSPFQVPSYDYVKTFLSTIFSIRSVLHSILQHEVEGLDEDDDDYVH